MAIAELKPGYELVHTVGDYHDGPRKGIADYKGKPHLYECIFDEGKDEYTESFRLAPVGAKAFQLAMEDWAIWKRWELAYHAGKVDILTHPALPHERERKMELKSVLQNLLVIDPAIAVTCTATFEVLGSPVLPQGVQRPLQVKWTEV
jgi:hypothetical protein